MFLGLRPSTTLSESAVRSTGEGAFSPNKADPCVTDVFVHKIAEIVGNGSVHQDDDMAESETDCHDFPAHCHIESGFLG